VPKVNLKSKEDGEVKSPGKYGSPRQTRIKGPKKEKAPGGKRTKKRDTVGTLAGKPKRRKRGHPSNEERGVRKEEARETKTARRPIVFQEKSAGGREKKKGGNFFRGKKGKRLNTHNTGEIYGKKTSQPKNSIEKTRKRTDSQGGPEKESCRPTLFSKPNGGDSKWAGGAGGKAYSNKRNYG